MMSLPFNWKWTDLREIALKLTKGDRKGLAMAAYALDWILPTYGIDFDGLLSHYPVPGKALTGAGTSPHLWMISSRESTYGVP